MAWLLIFVAASCTRAEPSASPVVGGDSATSDAVAATSDAAARGVAEPTTPAASDAEWDLPARPDIRSGQIAASVTETFAFVVPSLRGGALDARVAAALGASADARLGWVVSDLLRLSGPDDYAPLIDAFTRITGADLARAAAADGTDVWKEATDLLIAWDLPAPPGYIAFKRELFLALEPRWAPIFSDAGADIDWRFLSWGGVLPDDRPLGDDGACVRGCIPSLDDPKMTGASEGAWYPDDRIVFGVSLGGEAVAFPKNVMEVHEMVNFTIAGRRVAMAYCTLCGSAEAYFTDRVPGSTDPLVMRTSGLLFLSNKVMYDLASWSAFDTFNGRAVSGPLHRAGVALPRLNIVVSRWDAWRVAHPAGTIVAADGGIGRTYELDPLNGRDDNGPIFPVRRSDTRLAPHVQVLGVLAADGSAVAFPVDEARAVLAAGGEVRSDGIVVEADAGGLRATIAGRSIPTQQAFWFAWAQFHPDSALWTRTKPG